MLQGRIQQMFRLVTSTDACCGRLQVAALLPATMPELVAALLERTKPEVGSAHACPNVS